MSEERVKLQEAVCRYTRETLAYMETVRKFGEGSPNWLLEREKEVRKMMDIRDRADNKCNKCEAFGEYIKSKLPCCSCKLPCCSCCETADSRHEEQELTALLKETVGGLEESATADSRPEELQQELADVLKETVRGLQELDCFLDAVENLAVTSLHVFTEKNQVLYLPEGISPEHVQAVITAARSVCPLLLEFKRDANVFFLPKLQNVEVLSYQLDRYIQTTQRICDKLQQSCFRDFPLQVNTETLVDVSVDLSEDDVQRMLHQINQLNEIRMNQSFRTVFLFQEEKCCGFISEFSKRKPRMLQFLTEPEETAVQLDRMSKGAKISSVAGSSVGAVGGVLSIVGMAFVPDKAEVSPNLRIAGAVLAGLSAFNSLLTTIALAIVNYIQQNKAIKTFRSFMKDAQVVQNCLVKVIYQPVIKIQVSEIVVDKLVNSCRSIAKCGDTMFDAVSAVKLLKSEEVLASAGKVASQEGKALGSVPRVAADIPDIGQAAVKGLSTLSILAIIVNALFFCMDIIFICKDSVGLAKGSETELSQFIRARAALWSSEMDSWQKIHDFLTQGLQTSEENKALLETTFYPEGEI